MRDASLAVLREIGWRPAIQRAVRRQSGRRAHGGDRDEPRVRSRARLQGHRLSDCKSRRQARGRLHARRIANDITWPTPASFEPTIDYVVTKNPRFAFEKFPGASTR